MCAQGSLQAAREAAALATRSFFPAARLCGLGKGSSVAAASAGNRAGSVWGGQHHLSTAGIEGKAQAGSCCCRAAQPSAPKGA